MTRSIWKFVLPVLAFSITMSYGQSPNDKLFSRIYGCEAAVTIANSMGASVEGWTYDKIEQTYGFLDKFMPEDQKESVRPVRFGPKFVYHAYHREVGWGEDGMERYRLLTSAILKKNGRVNIEDVTREWIEKVDPAHFGYNVGPQDQVIYYLLKAGVPPWEVGRWALWPGFIGTSKMIMPVGLVNAGRPDNAGRDALDITRFKDVQGRPLWRDDTKTISKVSSVVYDYALECAAAIAAGAAEAIQADATTSSVIDAAIAQLPPGARIEVETVLGWAKNSKDFKEFRPLYQKQYQGKPVSAAVEILAGGLACFYFADGQPREAILYGINLGRDTDCKAYVAGGLAGALRGIEAIPAEWVETVEKGIQTDPYTVSKRTAREAAEGVYKACVYELRKSETAVNEIASMGVNLEQPVSAGSPDNQFFSRLYGCEAAATIGSAMGHVVDGESWIHIQKKFGSLEKLIVQEESPRRHAQRFGPEWMYQAYTHLPGMTEGGMELHRLLTSAIMKKNGRVNVEEVSLQWLSDIDSTKFGILLAPQDEIIYAMLKAGIPPWDVGRYTQVPASIYTGRMMMPVGMISACRPDEAARDALDIGRLKDVQGRPLSYSSSEIVYNYAIEVGAAIASATAEALRPEATVHSIVEAALTQLPVPARKEVEMGIDWARKAKNWKELASLYEKFYNGKPSSSALEVLSSSLACLIVSDGRPRDVIIASVNLGRDASSRASLAGGWAGALRGIKEVPAMWIEIIEKEVVNDPYTVSRRTARQAAEGIYSACLNEMQKSKVTNAKMGTLMAR